MASSLVDRMTIAVVQPSRKFLAGDQQGMTELRSQLIGGLPELGMRLKEIDKIAG